MKYDHIVVGAGSAGAIIATRLSEDPQRSVLLIEAGSDYPDFERLPDELKYGYGGEYTIRTSVHNWQFTGRATDKAPEMPVPRGKVTGGSSAINAQVFLRGVPEDFDSWASLGNDQWSFQNLLHYFRKIESDTEFGGGDFHNSDGPIIVRRFQPEEWRPEAKAFYDAGRAAGFPDCPDHNLPDAWGVGPCPFNNPNRIRWSTALGYLDPARHRLNLTIRPNCLVHRLVFEGKRAVGVEVESGGERFTVEGDEITLSAGAVGSPHILLLSGVGPAAELSNVGIPVLRELPGVGKNLRDHPLTHAYYRTKEGHERGGTEGRLQMILRWTGQDSDLRNDMQILMTPTRPGRVGPLGEGVGLIFTVVLNLAMGAGELTLTSADPTVQPFLDFRYLEDEFDRRRLREAVRLAVNLGQFEGFSDIIEERLEPTDDELASDEALDEFLMRTVTTAQHISCTCKMGPATDPMAVVDQYGRVHGLEGLRVADASIMPNCVRANTNPTTMVIGERIADFIRQGA